MHALRVRMRTVGWTALFTENGLTEGKGWRRHERVVRRRTTATRGEERRGGGGASEDIQRVKTMLGEAGAGARGRGAPSRAQDESGGGRRGLRETETWPNRN